MKKVLAVLVNYGEEQLDYLEKVVNELKSFNKYSVDVVVHSNIPLSNKNIDTTKIFKLEDFQLLPLTCKTTIWEQKENYDLFIYGENDHLFKEIHLDRHLEYSKILPVNRISGLIQYESNGLGYYYPGYHLDFDWDYNSVEVFDGKCFAHFTNVHQASFILTKEQLLRVGRKINFTDLKDESINIFQKIIDKLKRILKLPVERRNKYSVKCKVNTDIYLFGGMKKVICISDFEDNLIHHLPNLYIEGDKGRTKLRSDHQRMNKALKRLVKDCI